MTASNTRLYSGRSADERKAARRERLLDAALNLFGTTGYSRTSIEKLCTAAKVSTRHFYQQYANKEDALLDLYGDTTAQSFKAAAESLERMADAPIAEKVSDAISSYLGPLVSDVRLARISFVEIVGVSPRVEETRLSYRDGMIAMIETEGTAAVRRGEMADRDFRFAGLAFLGAVNTIVYDWTLQEDRRAVADLEQSLNDLAVTLLTH